ncbi:hypothetical protein [Mesoplasma melaleucae]|uniref:Uncharacterized protein n=1 Tax=Mesoplasma melaleucae TaxID=81459 RepID=A0A2K8NX51_9MOLU|nr:hypothetical protein [Mesoplasma melaleucae]ATZ18116.1 hypothetical protein EMELA_v1c05940 [Mesoplasma melaleucae]
MVQSVLYSENSFLVPIFFDALINWVYVFTILLLVVLTFILFFLEQEKEELENIEANYTFKPYDEHQSIILINKKIIIEDKLIKKTSYDQVTKSYLIIKLTEMHPEQSKKIIIKIVNNLIKLIEQNKTRQC